MFEFYEDGAYFRISRGTIAESDEVMPGVVADFDGEGNMVGIEWY